MPGFFEKTAKDGQNSEAIKEIQETRDRFIVFIGKLEDKLKEFGEASIPELQSLLDTDTDEFKRSYHRMRAAVLGQIESIRKKAVDVKEEKIDTLWYSYNDQKIPKMCYQFRDECYERHHQLDALCSAYRERVEDTGVEDFEVKYQRILDEHDAIKGKFRCTQCGSPITIDRIYFTTTYITCVACQTRNTFEPGSQARLLEHVARSLAEQRTKQLLKEHDAIPEKVHDLYLQAHRLELSLIHEKDKGVLAQKRKQIDERRSQKEVLEKKRPDLYYTYLRAMFDEWNSLNPALAEEHEKFYTRLLTDYKQYKL
ncbi:hypothetical protein LZZ85_27165 [Terrimonas sp. NA20]|uniref:Uncharacterized protein n=1 Tax=Terrimonas ginsenosidimutans TaxID=2908004 RepID=A0ABS9L0H4_9BACT|nr:hypothetical protein [Terrimonas ginsenosidimutans]MCG2618013.1 hypothetical protein [Terrimonas ginsenosidimutans]